MAKFTPRRAGDPPGEWRNLRDDKGRLYGRVNRVRWTLEVRTHGKTILFDLTECIEIRQSDDKAVK